MNDACISQQKVPSPDLYFPPISHISTDTTLHADNSASELAVVCVRDPIQCLWGDLQECEFETTLEAIGMLSVTHPSDTLSTIWKC